MKIISFKASKKDHALITQIVDRAVRLSAKHGLEYEAMDCRMDITATHANGCKLDLLKLLEADDFNFAHDVFGIRRHVNRNTGQLMGFFSPRCSKPTTKEAKVLAWLNSDSSKGSTIMRPRSERARLKR